MNELQELDSLDRQDEEREYDRRMTDRVIEAYFIKLSNKKRRQRLIAGIISLLISTWLLSVLLDLLK